MRVWDNRKSECFAVMAKIKIETLSYAKAGRLRDWSFSTGKVTELANGRKQMKAMETLACALPAMEVAASGFAVLLNQWL